jgi:hypothetical protein
MDNTKILKEITPFTYQQNGGWKIYRPQGYTAESVMAAFNQIGDVMFDTTPTGDADRLHNINKVLWKVLVQLQEDKINGRKEN